MAPGEGLLEPVKELSGRIDLVVLHALEPQERLGTKGSLLLPLWGLTS